MSSPEEPTSEIRMSPEDLIARLTTVAQSALTDNEIPSVLQPDGSSSRSVDPSTPITSSANLSAGLSEVTPTDGGAREYSLSFVTRARSTDTQYLTWQEGGTKITRGVRSSFARDEPLQVIEEVDPTQQYVDQLEARVGHLMLNYGQNKQTRPEVLEPQRSKVRHYLGWLAGLGSRIGKREK